MDSVAALSRRMRGDVTLKIEGLGLSELPGKLLAHGVVLTDMRRVSYVCLQVRTSYRDAQKLAILLADSPLRITTLRARGLPFTAQRLARRYVLLVGLLVGAVALVLFSTRIWTCRIEGCENVPSLGIRAELKALGLQPGMGKDQVDIPAWQQKLMISFPYIQWVSMEIQGVELVVRVQERSIPPAGESAAPGDLVAAMDGVVEEITVLRGQAMVKPGDSVKAGQVLIRGALVWGSDGEGGEAPTAAMGRVRGRITRQTFAQAPAQMNIAVPTGNMQVHRFLRVFNHRWVQTGRPNAENPNDANNEQNDAPKKQSAGGEQGGADGAPNNTAEGQHNANGGQPSFNSEQPGANEERLSAVAKHNAAASQAPDEWCGVVPYAQYQTRVESHPLGGAFVLFPVVVERVTFLEMVDGQTPADLAALEQSLLARCEDDMTFLLPDTAAVVDKKHFCDIIKTVEQQLYVWLWVEAEVELCARPLPNQREFQ